MPDEAYVLKELKSSLNLVETALELILPAGAGGYALNTSGKVCGLKIPFMPDTSPALLDTILQLRHLERLVIFSDHRPPLHLPPTVNTLTDLHFLWLGGHFKSLPPQILDLNLPIYFLGSHTVPARKRPRSTTASSEIDLFNSLMLALRNADLQAMPAPSKVDNKNTSQHHRDVLHEKQLLE
jgi:hypothetical protein